jgi:PPIC-type PPIASE domain
MGKSWLVCVLMGTLAWGQAQPAAPAQSSPAQATPAQAPSQGSKAPAEAPPAQANPAQASPAPAPTESKPPAPPPEVPMSAVVLTIKGVCPATPTAASKTAAADKTAATTAPPAAKKPADCKTELTRAQFEKIANGLSSNVTPQLKRQLEQALPRFMAMSEAAKKKGLDKSPQYLETLKVAKMQILTTQLQREVQEEADKIPPAKVEEQYKAHPETYEQFSLDRLFVPRYKQVQAEEKEEEKEPEKLNEEQQKVKEAAEKAKQEKGEQELTALADSLRARAAGEDFVKLQKEAFEAAGQKVENPTVNLPKVRRTGLPPAHAEVFDLKAGEVSKVISDNGGHYIYKVVSKEVLPLDQVKDEIHNKLKSERLKEMMDKYTNSFTAIPNEAYFGPAAAPGPQPPRGRMPMPPTPQGRPQGATPPAANPPAQPPTAPPTKPN